MDHGNICNNALRVHLSSPCYRYLLSLKREKQQSMPKYKEMCRRFLADSEDFSEDNLKAQHIEKRYANIDFELCLSKIIADIQKEVGV